MSASGPARTATLDVLVTDCVLGSRIICDASCDKYFLLLLPRIKHPAFLDTIHASSCRPERDTFPEASQLRRCSHINGVQLWGCCEAMPSRQVLKKATRSKLVHTSPLRHGRSRSGRKASERPTGWCKPWSETEATPLSVCLPGCSFAHSVLMKIFPSKRPPEVDIVSTLVDSLMFLQHTPHRLDKRGGELRETSTNRASVRRPSPWWR